MNGDVRGIVVLTSGWALRMARAHSRLLGTDCKHDTSAGRSMWSSARAATPKGWVPTVAWIAPTEDTELIQSALLVLADNVACHDPSCNHAVQIEWGQHGHPGSYRRRRVCRRWYQPRLCCDKHVPTLKAAEMAGYGDPIFDGYHSYHCVGDQLRKIGLQGEAACEVSWLFRLWTRSMTDEQAVSMRRHVVSHMLDRIAANSVQTRRRGRSSRPCSSSTTLTSAGICHHSSVMHRSTSAASHWTQTSHPPPVPTKATTVGLTSTFSTARSIVT